MYDLNNKKFNFDNNSTTVDINPSKIYVMQPDTG